MSPQDRSRYLEAVHRLASVSKTVARPATASEIDRWRSLGMPASVLALLQELSLPDGAGEMEMKVLSLELAESEQREYLPGTQVGPLGFVIVGMPGDSSGDMLAIDTAAALSPDGTPPILWVDHEWTFKSVEDVRSVSILVAQSYIDWIEDVAAGYGPKGRVTDWDTGG